jgi:hypothetical protein
VLSLLDEIEQTLPLDENEQDGDKE